MNAVKIILKPYSKCFSNKVECRGFLRTIPIHVEHTIDISHSTLNIYIYVHWGYNRVDEEDRLADVRRALPCLMTRRESRQREPSIASKVESTMERDEGCLSTTCTRSLAAVTESTGITTTSRHRYLCFSIEKIRRHEILREFVFGVVAWLS